MHRDSQATEDKQRVASRAFQYWIIMGSKVGAHACLLEEKTNVLHLPGHRPVEYSLEICQAQLMQHRFKIVYQSDITQV